MHLQDDLIVGQATLVLLKRILTMSWQSCSDQQQTTHHVFLKDALKTKMKQKNYLKKKTTTKKRKKKQKEVVEMRNLVKEKERREKKRKAKKEVDMKKTEMKKEFEEKVEKEGLDRKRKKQLKKELDEFEKAKSSELTKMIQISFHSNCRQPIKDEVN